MNHFEQALAQYIGAEQLKKIQSYTIGIAGAGGLGSNCALNLIRSGFNKLVLVDFDVVEYSNLNRQFYFMHQIGRPKVEALACNLRQINPDIELSIYQEKVTAQNVHNMFKDCRIIVEAFDASESKRMLTEECVEKAELFIAVSGIAGLEDSDNIRIRQVKDNFYIIGDFASEASLSLPPMAPRVLVAAAKQADVLIRHVLLKGSREEIAW